MKNWLCDLASEFCEGLADGFLIPSGGATATAAVGGLTPEQVQALLGALSLKAIGTTMLITGCYYMASFVKKNKPPFGQKGSARLVPTQQ